MFWLLLVNHPWHPRLPGNGEHCKHAHLHHGKLVEKMRQDASRVWLSCCVVAASIAERAQPAARQAGDIDHPRCRIASQYSQYSHRIKTAKPQRTLRMSIPPPPPKIVTASIQPSAYAKLVLHAAKYPSSSIGGYVIGTASSDDSFAITDVIPMCHNSPCGPMFEIAAEMVRMQLY